MQKTAYRYHFVQGRIFVFSFQKGRYFTVYKRRNKRHSESQTLYLFVEANACRNSGFSYGTHEILTSCENLSFLVASLQREEANSLHQLAVEPTAATKFEARCAFVLCL